VLRHAALGFAPHSGWAALVAAGGADDPPAVVARERVDMTDARLRGAKQPYHAVEDWPVAKAREHLERLSASAQSMAGAALRRVLRSLKEGGYLVRTAGILESAGRKGLPLESILASHALIHSAEGEHFRAALEEAAAACGLSVTRVPLRSLPDVASRTLRRPNERLQTAVQALGRPLGPPWGADQKSAALLAWTLLRAG
jgi:hypothetical protein